MHACAIVGPVSKWNVMVGQRSDLCRLRCTLPWVLNNHTASNLGFSRCRYYVRSAGEERITFHNSLHVPQRFQPGGILLLNSSLHPEVHSKQSVVKSNWCSALTQMLTSFARKCSSVAVSSVSFQEPASRFTCGSLLDFSSHFSYSRRSDVMLWCLVNCALLFCRAVSSTDNSLTHFSIMQRLNRSVGSNNSSRHLSQKPDKDSSQKPSAKQLHNVQQLMTIQVVQFRQPCLYFLYCFIREINEI